MDAIEFLLNKYPKIKGHWSKEKYDYLWIIQLMEEYSKYKKGWIDAKKHQPEMIKNENYSPNVLTVCNGELMVMSYCYNPIRGDSGGYFWANCDGNINGDCDLDDDYDVIAWQYLPKIDL
jgi:hypothetical protein